MADKWVRFVVPDDMRPELELLAMIYDVSADEMAKRILSCCFATGDHMNYFPTNEQLQEQIAASKITQFRRQAHAKQ